MNFQGDCVLDLAIYMFCYIFFSNGGFLSFAAMVAENLYGVGQGWAIVGSFWTFEP